MPSCEEQIVLEYFDQVKYPYMLAVLRDGVQKAVVLNSISP